MWRSVRAAGGSGGAARTERFLNQRSDSGRDQHVFSLIGSPVKLLVIGRPGFKDV